MNTSIAELRRKPSPSTSLHFSLFLRAQPCRSHRRSFYSFNLPLTPCCNEVLPAAFHLRAVSFGAQPQRSSSASLHQAASMKTSGSSVFLEPQSCVFGGFTLEVQISVGRQQPLHREDEEVLRERHLGVLFAGSLTFGEQRRHATCCRDQHCLFFFFLPTILESQREPPLASSGGKELLLELCAGPQGAALRGTARTRPGAATLSSGAGSCPAICTWKCLCLDLLGFESRFSQTPSLQTPFCKCLVKAEGLC